MDRVYEKGDLFYRFKFNLDGHVTTDIFVVTNVHISNSIRIRLEPIDEDSNTSFKQGISFYSKGNIGVVKTKSLNKYIMLDKNDEEEARRILLEYVTKKRDEYQQRLEQAEQWILVAKGEA